MSLASEAILTVTETLESAINLLLQQDPHTLERLAALQGKCLAMSFTEPALTLYLFPHAQGVQVQYLYQGQADTTLSGTPLAFARLAAGDATEVFFRGEVQIRGDIELGQRFKRILQHLNIDWEEWLAEYCGDLLAVNAARLVRRFGQWGQQTLATLQQDVSEYLQQESRLNPQPEEIEHFSNEVATLRDAVARLQARIARLQSRIDTA